jgi:hypothetical protein
VVAGGVLVGLRQREQVGFAEELAGEVRVVGVPALVKPLGRQTVGWPVRLVISRSPPPTYQSTFSNTLAISRMRSVRARRARR